MKVKQEKIPVEQLRDGDLFRFMSLDDGPFATSRCWLFHSGAPLPCSLKSRKTVWRITLKEDES